LAFAILVVASMGNLRVCIHIFVLYLATASILTNLLMWTVAEGYCWSRTSERQVLRIRHLYLQAILRQEVAFFDSQEATTSEIINSISKDASLIQEVLSEKVVHITNQSYPLFSLLNLIP
jgi:ABC-type multidrug transport system fused ATPase/permease subunit